MSDPQQLRDAIMEALDDNDAFSAGDDEVATVLEAIDAAGWAVVPKVATEAMLNATMRNESGGLYPRAGRADIYAAMLAAGAVAP